MTEVWEEWFGGRRLREYLDGFLVESTGILYRSNATCVISEDFPFDIRKRAAKPIALLITMAVFITTETTYRVCA